MPPKGGTTGTARRALPLLALSFLLFATPLPAQLPALAHAVTTAGAWTLPDTIRISWNNKSAEPAEALLREILPRPVAHTDRIPSLSLQIGSAAPGDESYILRVTDSGAVISAPSISGLRWGAQTLRQLIADADSGRVPAMEIRDEPRYPWRGVMLDVGRHFFPVADILRWIDIFARYKLNVFHWHLTDDQGWRLASAKYPRLTSVGGFRIEADGSRSGGFYTAADVRRVVAYAESRGITVVPEIEMPGHARAAIAAYPALGCTGKALPVPNGWGVFDDVLCPTEPTFKFLEGVLTEVLALFPSKYIHIGGDEVPKTRWQECTACLGVIAREKLGDNEGLQRWFTARIASWLKDHGRRMIGWDEILNGGAPDGAVVQAWQGSERIAVALKAGADVIASPSEWVYINRSAEELPLERILKFDPRAGSGDSPRILGGEAPLWTENVTSPVNVELMLFPRLSGFAEVMWRGPTDLAEFTPRLARELPRLAAAGIAVGPSDAALPSIVMSYDSALHALRATVANGIPGVAIRTTRKGRIRDVSEGALSLTDSGTMTLQLMRGTSRIRDARVVSLTNHLAAHKPVSLANPADVRYPGTGPFTLTDGATSVDFHDGLSNGWLGKDLDATIDLGKVTPLRTVALSLLEDVRSWIVYPTSVNVQLSDDGNSWRDGGTVSVNVPTKPEGRSTKVVMVTLPPKSAARWIRVVAKNAGALPSWHPGAGEMSWVFADEVIVR
ncbi:MAG: family 20 glycosylhydrolase [Gemmatimonadota bacterium]